MRVAEFRGVGFIEKDDEWQAFGDPINRDSCDRNRRGANEALEDVATWLGFEGVGAYVAEADNVGARIFDRAPVGYTTAVQTAKRGKAMAESTTVNFDGQPVITVTPATTDGEIVAAMGRLIYQMGAVDDPAASTFFILFGMLTRRYEDRGELPEGTPPTLT